MPNQLGPMTASISFQGNIACGGSAALVLNEDGTCTFNGSFIPYGVAFALVVNTTSGKAFSFVKSGQVFGTVSILADSTKSRNFTWNDMAKNADVAAAWGELVAGSDYHWKADVNTNVIEVLSDVVGIVKQIGPILGSVIAVI
jgi:hypothetical protein